MTLTTTNNFACQLSELDKVFDMCKKLMATPHYRKLGEEGIHAIMAKAKALDISPFEALNGGFYCVQGRVGMSTEMMAALARQRGHSITQVENTDKICTLKGRRADNKDEWVCTFTQQDAERAGLWNQATWKKYPKVMLYNRCMSMLFRQLFPDLSLGAGYVKDELDEIAGTGDYAQGLPVAESEVVPQPERVAYENPTSEQAKELEIILTQCSPTYQASFKNRLLARKWNSIEEMEIGAYKQMREHALEKMAEHKVSQNPPAKDEEVYEVWV